MSKPSNKIDLEDIVLGKIYQWQCFVCDLREAYGSRAGRRAMAANECINEFRAEGTVHCGDYFVAVALVPGGYLGTGFVKIITMTKEAFTTCVDISGVRAVNTDDIVP